MRRRTFLIGLSGALVAPRMALARDFVAEIVAQLGAAGYEIDRISRTWLGRVRIRAHNARGEREIVINPVTGEILRDLWVAGRLPGSLFGDASGSDDGSGSPAGDDDGGQGRGRGRGRGRGGDDDDDSDDDDHDHDDRDDDD